MTSEQLLTNGVPKYVNTGGETMRYYCEDPELGQLYKKHDDDAGFDICANDSMVISDTQQVLVKTGLHIAIPHGCVGILKPRSGLSISYGTNIGAGVIDENYRGEICVVLSVLQPPFCIYKGDRIAQLLVLQLPAITPERVNSLEELGETDRGSDGFGSTGRS